MFNLPRKGQLIWIEFIASYSVKNILIRLYIPIFNKWNVNLNFLPHKTHSHQRVEEITVQVHKWISISTCVCVHEYADVWQYCINRHSQVWPNIGIFWHRICAVFPFSPQNDFPSSCNSNLITKHVVFNFEHGHKNGYEDIIKLYVRVCVCASLCWMHVNAVSIWMHNHAFEMFFVIKMWSAFWKRTPFQCQSDKMLSAMQWVECKLIGHWEF